ncbi:hypothetical protein P171DRAFT_487289 [Karstenula rhodostoma CBS 690.94]|uniref:Uncharacterized protein n=1 Tax=Karstenula rhodostoma CBS 690.94 TaxID=1392251 RepID=A0A9P4UAF4_9PLEO|nr:hypothetical protein P171DRAFT_487289 [Karstenula rhodostoma CBS 690.94]
MATQELEGLKAKLAKYENLRRRCEIYEDEFTDEKRAQLKKLRLLIELVTEDISNLELEITPANGKQAAAGKAAAEKSAATATQQQLESKKEKLAKFEHVRKLCGFFEDNFSDEKRAQLKKLQLMIELLTEDVSKLELQVTNEKAAAAK